MVVHLVCGGTMVSHPMCGGTVVSHPMCGGTLVVLFEVVQWLVMLCVVVQ